MILGFYRAFDKKTPTFFREKIRACVTHQTRQMIHIVNGIDVTVDVTLKPKRHTIRHDKSKRWRTGMKIDMVYRGKFYRIDEKFNEAYPSLQKCRYVQDISIEYRRRRWITKHKGKIPVYTLRLGNQFLVVTIDGCVIGHKTLKELAINDGFDSITNFLRYFRKSIRNWSLIHWTDLKY